MRPELIEYTGVPFAAETSMPKCSERDRPPRPSEPILGSPK
jgi:hypothetical protein